MKSYEKVILVIMILYWLITDDHSTSITTPGAILLGAAIIYHAITKEKK